MELLRESMLQKKQLGGSDVVLTIDANLQEVTERALAQCIQNIRDGYRGFSYDAKGGTAVVMDVNNGEVLAMASNPDYTPQVLYDGISNEQYADYDARGVWSNKAIQGGYAPGSTFKMVTALAGLESGVINATEKINDTGIYYAGKDRSEYHCWYYDSNKVGHGPLNVVGALAKSCNFFFYETGNRAGIETVAKYAKHFGLGLKTGIELTGEISGLVSSPETRKDWTPGWTLISSIGQGDNSFTSLQIAKYISMIANGGNNLDVSIIRSIMNSDGSTVSREEINEFSKKQLNLDVTSSDSDDIVINPDNLAIVKKGMEAVTDEGGTAVTVFRDFPINVAGKTGSAEAPGNLVHAWFVGFAPYENPQIAVVVMVENGGHGFYTADVVKEIIEEYFGMDTTKVTENMSVEDEMESLN